MLACVHIYMDCKVYLCHTTQLSLACTISASCFKAPPKHQGLMLDRPYYVVSANNTGGGEQVYDTEKFFTVITPCP